MGTQNFRGDDTDWILDGRSLQHREGERMVRTKSVKCENQQRMNSNILRLNHWYMQEMAEVSLERNPGTTL